MADAWAEKQFEKIAEDARKCAEHYEKNPGTFDVRAIIDLYSTIARLADTMRLTENGK